MSRKLSRRRFLQASSAAAGFWLTGGLSLTRADNDSPNNRLNVAVIGCGGRGADNVAGCAGENIVALCDVDEARARGTFDRYPEVPKFKDYRVLLDRARDIDAVVVSTPDHMHAHAAAAAMRLGKHVYCEKPLTHSVWEARQLRELAARQRVATQMGNQGTSDGGLRQNVEIIRSGALGDVREVHVWTDRPGRYWRQGHTARPAETPAVPATLDWDLWLGCAPARPYHSAYVPFSWRGWWDFGTGALGDMACHLMNMPYLALELGPPKSVVAETDQPVNAESPPNGLLVTYEFPARGNRPPVILRWYEVRRPPQELFQGQEVRAGGCLVVGSRGTLYCRNDYGGGLVLLPQEMYVNYQPPAATLPRSPGHHAEWIRACKGGPPPMSNFVDHAGPLTEMVLLGNVAIRTAGQRLEWDPAQFRVTNHAPANQWLKREYRRGWEF